MSKIIHHLKLLMDTSQAQTIDSHPLLEDFEVTGLQIALEISINLQWICMEENNSPTIMHTSSSKIKNGVQVGRTEWVPSRHKTWRCGVIRDGQVLRNFLQPSSPQQGYCSKLPRRLVPNQLVLQKATNVYINPFFILIIMKSLIINLNDIRDKLR
jgi:hypothetical protein